MRRRHVRAAVPLVLLLAGGLGLSATPAVAQLTAHTVVPSADPVNTTPDVLDGEVHAVAEVGDITLVGGTFSQVQHSLGGPVLARTNLFAFRTATGEILSTFNPTVSDMVYEILPSGDGTTAYVGGAFAGINGAARTNRVARINATTGATDPTFVSPSFNGQVKDMSLRNGLLYLGGNFTTTAGGQARTVLAAVNPATGALQAQPNLTFSEPRNGGALQIIKFDITPNGSALFAIGNFAKVNAQDRYQAVKIDLTATTATLAGWQTTKFTTACSSSFDTYMRDIDIDPTGTYAIIGTTGAYSGGPNAGTLCDSVSRWETAATGTGQLPTWADYTGGDTTWAVAATGAAVYAGGHFRWFNNPYASDAAGQGAVAREGVAALDPRNGLPLSWNPGRDRGVGVFAFLATARGLWMGSDTDWTAGENRKKIALFPTAGGAKLPDDFTGTLPGTVYSVGAGSTNAIKSRGFSGTAVTGSGTVGTGGSDWSTARGAFMVDGTVYSGTSLGTLQARTFDGTTFGASSDVNLNGLTNFGTELKTVTGAFFDASTGRLYFTLSGQSRLFYRYFTPESRTVGAVRTDGPANLVDLNWSQVSSMFQSGGYLYVASSADGNLRRYAWSSATGTPTAGATIVSGPAKDGQDWRARGAFAYAARNGLNQPPTAEFTSSCAGLQCTLSSTSTDVDGTVAGTAWNYGDGTTGTGSPATHLYGAAGTYTVTLTATDDDGATATVSHPVAVTAPASAIAFRGAAGADANSTQVATTVPAAVQAGDTLVMIATANLAVTMNAPTGVTGWTQVATQPGNTMQSTLWTKKATAADAGATVRVPLSAAAKVSLQVLAYSGSTAAGPVSAYAAGVETVTQAAHTTPAVTVPTSGSYVVSYWADKTTDTSAWTVPTGTTARIATLGTGSGHITAVAADPGSGSAAGPAGTLTATANSANSKAMTWSIVLAP